MLQKQPKFPFLGVFHFFMLDAGPLMLKKWKYLVSFWITEIVLTQWSKKNRFYGSMNWFRLKNASKKAKKAKMLIQGLVGEVNFEDRPFLRPDLDSPWKNHTQKYLGFFNFNFHLILKYLNLVCLFLKIMRK